MIDKPDYHFREQPNGVGVFLRTPLDGDGPGCSHVSHCLNWPTAQRLHAELTELLRAKEKEVNESFREEDER